MKKIKSKSTKKLLFGSVRSTTIFAHNFTKTLINEGRFGGIADFIPFLSMGTINSGVDCTLYE